MERVIFTSAKGDIIRFDGSPYFLQTVEGLGDVEASIQTRRTFSQDGSTYSSNVLNERYIPINFLLVADEKSIPELRIEAAKALNPKLGMGVLQYENDYVVRRIEAIPESLPYFPDGRTDVMQKASVTFLCPNPYFTLEAAENVTPLASWEPKFEFPLEIVENEGVEFGVRSPSLIVNVLNEGHVESGMTIEFRALGTLVKPSLINVNTGEFFKINKTLVAGEVITVNTNKGKKRVESTVNGVTTNIFNKIIFGSTFLQLGVGDNLLRYDAEQGLDALEVSIYHTPHFVGV